MKTAALITHSHPPAATEAVAVAVAAAARRRLAAGRRPQTSSPSTATRPPGSRSAERRTTTPDLCLVLGGDGTILHALRRFARTGVPVFGVNFGTVGFLAAVERDEAEEGIRRAFAGEIETIELPGLEVDGRAAAAASASTTSPSPAARTTGSPSSATGSPARRSATSAATASSPPPRSARPATTSPTRARSWPGGWRATWSATSRPHSLTARALVVAPSDVLHVGNAAGREPVEVAVDGDQIAELAPGDELEVRFVDGVGRLAQLPGTSFYERIREKFGHLAV